MLLHPIIRGVQLVLVYGLICAFTICSLTSLATPQAGKLPSNAYAQPGVETAPPKEKLWPDAPPILRIGPGDLLEVTVSTGIGPPELNWKGRVTASGDILLPLVGSFHVLGLPVEEAEAIIGNRYRDQEILKNPQVDVFVEDYASQGISVLGEVVKPGIYPQVTSRRLLDLISQAGGLTPTAGNSITITHRDSPLVARTIRLSRDLSQSLEQNVDILPGDTIVVAKAGVVYVVGAVGKPGGFTMSSNEGITVLQALALAEGAKFDASLDKSKLIRKTATGREEIPIPLRKILSSEAADLTLKADDIVFVPSSKAKSATRRGLEAAIQTATGVVVYRAY